MRGETLVQQHPPTPPSTNGEYQAGLQHIAHYNTSRGFAYASPRTIAHEGIPSHASHVVSHPGERLGLGIQYEGYGPAGDYYQDGQYHGMPVSSPVLFDVDVVIDDTKMEQPLFSPPTPRSTAEDEFERRTTRSGRPVAASSSPQGNDTSPRPKATPKSKKPKAPKADKAATPKLTAPLSILTAELHHIPIKNMEEWVNRPAEVRRDEAEKRNGYITRPMNSFMLYRSAYAERAKAWCAKNNHQIVSSVAGESWPLEPSGIRDLYNEYAKIERINHQNAHPTYKFSPSKAAAPPKKRKAEWSDEDEPSDLDDAEWAPGGSRARDRQARRLERSVSYPSNGMNQDYFDRSFGPNGHGINKSSWEMTNEGRPMPMPIPMPTDMYNQYYQTAAYPGMVGANYQEDMRMRRVEVAAPPSQFASNHALLGLPGGNANDLMQQLHPHGGSSFEGQLDPMLLAYDGSHHSDLSPTMLQPGYRNPGMLDGKMDQQDIDSLLQISPTHNEYRSGPWQSDPTMVSLEQESEFEKWMGEQ